MNSAKDLTKNKKRVMKKIEPGLYVTSDGELHVNIKEALIDWGLPDTFAFRELIYNEARILFNLHTKREWEKRWSSRS